MFAGAFIFSAASNVYKQSVLQQRDVDVWFATFWSGNFQVLWGFLLIPLQWIPYPDQELPDPPKRVFQDIADTMSCLAGNSPQPGDEQHCPRSPNGLVWSGLYFSFNLFFNVCLLSLTKAQGANWATIASVLCLFISSVFSQWKLLMGKNATQMTYFDYMALVLAGLALWCYSLFGERKKGSGGGEEEVEMAGVSAAGEEEEDEGVVGLLEDEDDLESGGVKAPLVSSRRNKEHHNRKQEGMH